MRVIKDLAMAEPLVDTVEPQQVRRLRSPPEPEPEPKPHQQLYGQIWQPGSAAWLDNMHTYNL
jgi:hypothetical protein